MFRRGFLKAAIAGISGIFSCWAAGANGMVGEYVMPKKAEASQVPVLFTPGRLRPGQIYTGECLTSWEPSLTFRYILLSRDRVDETDEWTVAQFNMGFKPGPRALGAQVIKLLPCEITDRINKGDLKLAGYIGNG